MLVKFHCPRCKIHDEVEVRDRRPEEPFDYWARRIALKAVTAKHSQGSLLCEHDEFDVEFAFKESELEKVETPPTPAYNEEYHDARPIPKGYADIADLEEDQRIELIGKTLMKYPVGMIVAVCVDDEPEKVARYKRKIVTAFPLIEVIDQFRGPVENVMTIRIQRKPG